MTDNEFGKVLGLKNVAEEDDFDVLSEDDGDLGFDFNFDRSFFDRFRDRTSPDE